MSIKKLLGLELFPYDDVQIIQKIVDARKRKSDLVEFHVPGSKPIQIRVSRLTPEGIMHGEYRMYKNPR
jgi:hypothetical protein